MKFIILLIVVIFAAAGVFYFQKYSFSKDGEPAYTMEIRTEKELYARGEPVKFVVTNEGTKPVWYLVPPAKCKNDFHWSLLSGKEKSWDIVYKYPKCEIGKGDYDFIETKTLDPNESLNGAWDQKLFSDSTENRFAEPGKYKIVFYYSGETINKSDIKNESDPGTESAYSLQFEISDDFYDDSIKSEVQKENDRERKSDLSEIKKALEAYYREKDQKYPASQGFVKLNDKNSEVYHELSGYANAELLSDPNDPQYYYGYNSSASGFELSARLENIEDESCEMAGESLCLYKIDSLGNVSQKKYPQKPILTIGETVDTFVSKSGIFDDPNSIIMITSDLIGGTEQAMIEEANTPENVRVVKAGDLKNEELSKNNLVVIGTLASNPLIRDIYKKTSVIDIADSADYENNNIKAVFRFSKNPWNDKKNVLIVDLDYSFGALVRIQGSLKSENIGEFYHMVFNSNEGEVYALVQSFEKDGAGIGNMNDFAGKNVEIYGYKRIGNSKEFPIEDSLGVIEISILD